MPLTLPGSKSKKNIKSSDDDWTSTGAPNLPGSKSKKNIKPFTLPGSKSKKDMKSSDDDSTLVGANYNYAAAAGVIICGIISMKMLPFLSLIAFTMAVYLGTVKLQSKIDTGEPTSSLFKSKRALSPGRLRYRHAGGWCAQKMTATFLDDENRRQVVASDDENTIELPPGAKQIQVSFGVKGGASLKKIDRRHPKQPWVTLEDGKHVTDVFDFDRGDGVDASFELHGRALHMYVKKAWDDGRPKHVKPRHWEWWDDKK